MVRCAILRRTLALGFMLLLSAAAQAQLFRAYLAPSGVDTNPCTLPSPCRLLPAALAAVANGGEIWMLDSANYNTASVVIDKSVTILAVPGVEGSILSTLGAAIYITTPGVKVVLRNLLIVPLAGSASTTGISMSGGAGLTVEKCVIANMTGNGIIMSGAASLRITDSTIRDNGVYGVFLQDGVRATVTRATVSGNANAGIYLHAIAAGVTTTADIADSTLDGNQYGVYAWSQNATAVLKVSVRDSRALRNIIAGLMANSSVGGVVTLSASNNIVSNNGSGIVANQSGSKVWTSGNTVSENVTGLSNPNNFGVFESANNNAVRNNGVETSGAITTFATK